MEHDVIVVGAGISGLATADALCRLDRRVLVVDAASRSGGRLRSVGGFDLGASWYWPGEHRVARLVEEFDVPTHPQFLDGDAVYDGPDGVVRLDGNPIDVPAHRFSSGADSVTAALSDRVVRTGHGEIRLERQVQHIDVASDGRRLRVTMIDPDGEQHIANGAHVVLALPPALAVRTIRFSPQLPHDVAALSRRTPVWMGSITKVVAHYDTPFWRDRGLSGSAVSHRGPMREIHDLSGPQGRPAALFGFAPTNTASGPIEPTEVTDQLARLFGPGAARPQDLHLTDWSREPHTSPPDVEQLTDYSTFGDSRYHAPSQGGRLHWTSTETASVAPGHIEGALSAAERTVDRITATDGISDRRNHRQQENPPQP